MTVKEFSFLGFKMGLIVAAAIAIIWLLPSNFWLWLVIVGLVVFIVIIVVLAMAALTDWILCKMAGVK